MKIFISFLLIILCVACTQKPARIMDRSHIVYSKKHSKKNYQVEVENGDTVYTVARKNQTSVRDLIKQNNLSAPYNLKKGSRLTIPPSSYHRVRSGETLYAISRLYDMNVDDLVMLNNLQAPYQIQVGQELKVAKTSADAIAKQKVVAVKEEIKSIPQTIKESVKNTVDKLNHFSWPLRGPVISTFGPKKGGLYNDGINIKAKEGAEVKVAEDGEVAYVGNELKGYGNLIIIKHSGGWITAYAHLKQTFVNRGQNVKKGQRLATVGMTGNVTSPQLYFGIRKGRNALNPLNYLK